MKGVIAIVLGFMIGLPAAVMAEETSGSFDSLSSPNTETLRFPAVSFSDLQAYAPSDKTDWIAAQNVDFAPLPRPARATPVRRMALITNDGSKEILEQPPVSVRSRYHVSGEIGAAYGVSVGKYNAESEGGYIVGGVGDDKMQITAGASYENTTFHVPRFGH
jgi:hypothetical protein